MAAAVVGVAAVTDVVAGAHAHVRVDAGADVGADAGGAGVDAAETGIGYDHHSKYRRPQNVPHGEAPDSRGDLARRRAGSEVRAVLTARV